MKKLLVIAIAVIAILVMSVPAMADPTPTPTPSPTTLPGVGTGVGISGGSGAEPIVKAKWETTDNTSASAENGDPSHSVPRTQVYPPVSYGGTQQIAFWAVVTDNPITDITVVSVEVYHPAGYTENGSWKFEVILNDYQDALADGVMSGAEATAAINAFNAAYLAGLVKLNDGITAFDVTEEISQGEAYLWYGWYVMSYHQPWGCYKVDAFAIDAGPVHPDSHLINWFDYLPVTAFEIDFNTVTYGNITTNGTVSGDNAFGTGGPTMRNIGNTWLKLNVQQDDMGFGIDSGSGDWNVEYDARLGSLIDYPKEPGNPNEGATSWYDPAGPKGSPSLPSPAKWTTLNGVVHLCNTWKIDFSIHIIKAIDPNYSGYMWLQAIYAPFTGPNLPHPGI